MRAALVFDGRCEEALEFYRGAIGAEVVMLMRCNEMPDPAERAKIAPGLENNILHSAFQVGKTKVMASDARNQNQAAFRGITLALQAADEPEAERLFTNLAKGGQVQMPLTRTFFSPAFGMLTDRFGVAWMVNVSPEDA